MGWHWAVPEYWSAVLGLVEIHLQNCGVYCWQAAGAFVLAVICYSQQGLVDRLSWYWVVPNHWLGQTAGRNADWAGAVRSLLVEESMSLSALGLVWGTTWAVHGTGEAAGASCMVCTGWRYRTLKQAGLLGADVGQDPLA